jgi:hypothetical protein
MEPGFVGEPMPRASPTLDKAAAGLLSLCNRRALYQRALISTRVPNDATRWT